MASCDAIHQVTLPVGLPAILLIEGAEVVHVIHLSAVGVGRILPTTEAVADHIHHIITVADIGLTLDLNLLTVGVTRGMTHLSTGTTKDIGMTLILIVHLEGQGEVQGATHAAFLLVLGGATLLASPLHRGGVTLEARLQE